MGERYSTAEDTIRRSIYDLRKVYSEMSEEVFAGYYEKKFKIKKNTVLKILKQDPEYIDVGDVVSHKTEELKGTVVSVANNIVSVCVGGTKICSSPMNRWNKISHDKEGEV